jgi:hypothetical protein
MEANELKFLITQFRQEAKRKLQRAYLIASRLDKLSETREAMCLAFKDVELEAYKSIV